MLKYTGRVNPFYAELYLGTFHTSASLYVHPW